MTIFGLSHTKRVAHAYNGVMGNQTVTPLETVGAWHTLDDDGMTVPVNIRYTLAIK